MKKLLFLCTTVFLVACSATGDRATLIGPDGETVRVKIEIADSGEERSHGLMFRRSLDADAGMLFVYPGEGLRSFWMKNTIIPLDILFFDSEGQIVSTTTMTPCKKDPCTTYLSAAPAQYVLEVNKGFIADHEIGEGWTIQWNGMDSGNLQSN